MALRATHGLEGGPLTFEEKKEVKVRHGAGRCPYCHDLISDTRELVACAGCGARQHERCYEEHGTCSSCGGTDVLVPLARGKPEQAVRPPTGSTIDVDERPGGTAYSWNTKKTSQLVFALLFLACLGLTIPLIPFVWAWWVRRGETRARVLLHDEGLDLKLERPFAKTKTVFAKRSDVGSILLTRNAHFLALTIDVGVDRIRVATAGAPQQPGVTLKEPELEWLYERLKAWKEQG